MNERRLLVRFGADMSEWEKALVAASKSARDFAKELTGLGTTLTKSITAPLAALATASVASSETIDSAMDRIRVGTGATGADLSKLGDTFRAVFKEVPASAGDVSTAITELSRRTGATGEALSGAATQMLELARVTGGEVKPLIESTSKAFNNWGIATKNQSKELDFLFKVSQATGTGVGELSDTLSSSGAAMRALGLDFDEAAALAGQFSKAGIDSGTMMAGLTKAATSFAKEGKSMSQGLREAIQEIKNAPTPEAAAQEASERFGKSCVAVADAVKRGGFEVDDFVRKLRASPETIHRAAEDTAHLSESCGVLSNKVTAALEPIGVAITKVLIDLMGVLGSLVDNVVAPAIKAFGALPEPVQSAIVVMGGMAAAIGPVLVAVGGMIATFASLSTAFLSVQATMGPAIASITGLFATGGGMIAGAWGAVTGAFAATAGVVGTVVSGLGTVAAALLEFAVPIAAVVAGVALIVANWDTLKAGAISAGTAIRDGLKSAWSSIATEGSSFWESFKATVSSGVSAVVAKAKAMGSALLDAVKSAMGPYYDSVVEGLGKVSTFAGQQWDALKAAAADAGSWVMAKLQGLLDGAKGVASQIVATMSQMAQSVKESMSEAQAAKDDWQKPNPIGQIISDMTDLSPDTSTMLPGGRAGGAKDIIVGADGKGSVSGGSSNGVRDTGEIGADYKYGGNTINGVQYQNGVGAPAPTPYSGPGVISPAIFGYRSQADAASAAAGGYMSQGDAASLYPRMADGGIVDTPGGMHAIIGEAGPEAVVPLSRGRGAMGGFGGPSVINLHFHVAGSIKTARGIADDLAIPIRDKLKDVTRNGGAT